MQLEHCHFRIFRIFVTWAVLSFGGPHKTFGWVCHVPPPRTCHPVDVRVQAPLCGLGEVGEAKQRRSDGEEDAKGERQRAYLMPVAPTMPRPIISVSTVVNTQD
ncbi:hypothetical protein J6590_065809 [Homalodisca vitripennis]|nr:hypothetical protein J6590_065809 [Homalodisca vitripennis]